MHIQIYKFTNCVMWNLNYYFHFIKSKYICILKVWDLDNTRAKFKIRLVYLLHQPPDDANTRQHNGRGLAKCGVVCADGSKLEDSDLNLTREGSLCRKYVFLFRTTANYNATVHFHCVYPKQGNWFYAVVESRCVNFFFINTRTQILSQSYPMTTSKGMYRQIRRFLSTETSFTTEKS